MEQNSPQTQDKNLGNTAPAPSRPNEQGVLNIDDFLRIRDPNTNQIFVEKRS